VQGKKLLVQSPYAIIMATSQMRPRDCFCPMTTHSPLYDNYVTFADDCTTPCPNPDGSFKTVPLPASMEFRKAAVQV